MILRRSLMVALAALSTLLLALAGCNSGTSNTDITPTVGQTTPVQAPSASPVVATRGKGGRVTPPVELALEQEALDPSQTSAVAPSAKATPLPSAASLNLTYVPPVMDQGQLESCGAFAVGYGLATFTANQQAGIPSSSTDVESSPAYMYAAACVREGQTCVANSNDGGTTAEDYFTFLIGAGSQTVTACPYTTTSTNDTVDGLCGSFVQDLIVCTPQPTASPTPSVTTVEGCLAGTPLPQFQLGGWQYYGYPTTRQIASHIANGQGVAILVNCYTAMNKWYGKTQTDVFTGNNETANDGSHFMWIIGYDDTIPWTNPVTNVSGTGAFLVQNSWGTTFGYQGRWWMAYPTLLPQDSTNPKASLIYAYTTTPVQATQTPTSSGTTLDASGGAQPPGGRVISAWQRADSNDDKRVNLVMKCQFDRAVQVHRVTLTAPNGETVTQAVRFVLRDGYLHFSRRDGLAFATGRYRVAVEGVDYRCADCGKVSYTGFVRLETVPSGFTAGQTLGTSIYGPTGKPATVLQ